MFIKLIFTILSLWAFSADAIASWADQPLILTPYIQARQFTKAKQLSKITKLPSLPPSDTKYGYSGYLTVNKSCDGNLFFWFVRSTAGSNAPILLWLQGGPGAASTFGNLIQTGPYQVFDNATLKEAKFTWAKKFHMLYIDSPIGTGFSFGNNQSDCFSKDEASVSANFYEALKQFFTLFSEYKRNPFFLTGESYAGKYVPALAYRIHKDLKNSRQYFNFTGISIGDALIDPINQIDYAQHLFWAGLIDTNQALQLQNTLNEIKRLIVAEDYDRAMTLFEPLVFNSDKHSMLYNYTGMTYHYNVLVDSYPARSHAYDQFMTRGDLRKALHVFPKQFQMGEQPYLHLKQDVLKSIKDEFAVILHNYPTLLYNGQLDIIIPAPFTENFLNRLESGANGFSRKFANATRKIWRLPNSPNKVAGYVKQVEKFRFVVVRRADHMVPLTAPEEALAMITSFVEDSI